MGITGGSYMSKRSQNMRKPRKDKKVEVSVDDKALNLQDLKDNLHHVMVRGKGDNDPEWYKNIPSVYNDVANIYMSTPAGSLRNPFKSSAPATMRYSEHGGFTAPAIMVMDVMPTIGPTRTPQDAANIAAQQFYTMVNMKNSRSKSYDKTDLMMVVIAMANAYALYEELLRAYRLLGKYDYNNRYMPDFILERLGFSPKLGADLSDFRGVLDLFAYQLSSMNIPDIFSYVSRQSWMYSNVYKDAADAKAQMYAFRPAGYYIWTEGEDSKPTYLKWTPRSAVYGASGNIVQSLFEIRVAIATVMKPLLGSSDIGDINRDVAMAFGDAGMIKIKPVADYEALEPVYNEEVLVEISNTHMPFLSQHLDSGTVDITVDNTNLSAGPQLKQFLQVTDESVTKKWEPLPVAYVKPLFNLIDVQPNEDTIMVGTRLMTSVEPTSAGLIDTILYGTEIVTSFAISVKQAENEVFTSTATSSQINLTADNYSTMVKAITLRNSFDWAPPLYVFYTDSSGNTVYLGTTIDLCNYVAMESTDLENLHSTAIMSLFAAKGYNFNS